MSDEEILQELSKLNKKLDKILNLNTKIAKTLHLIPVSEKEEMDIQIRQREAVATQRKVNDQLNAMENKPLEPELSALNLADLGAVFAGTEDVYDDIIDSDYLGG